MIKTKLKKQIIKEIDKARKGNYLFNEIQRYKPNPDNKHEMVFFIKPEITGADTGVNIPLFLDMISNSFDRYNISIDGVFVLGAAYLKKYDIMAKHYGVINKLSRDGVKAFSELAAKKFEDIFKIKPDNADILGSFQFLDRYRFFNSKSLDIMWENLEIKRLMGGTYCERLKIGGNTIYVINGFHPNQLDYYILPGKSIVVMVISSYTDWNVLRDEMVGFTDPKKAYKGTIRRTLLDKKNEFNIKVVSQSYNGVHLSAGPIESLAELIRFISPYDKRITLKPSDTAIGKKMINAGIPEDKLEWLITNPKVAYLDKEITIFDLTEGLNLEDAIGKIKEVSGI